MIQVSALILAGGYGSRLRPITETTPKCLVPIQGKPLLDYWLERLANAGVVRVRINTHHLPAAVRSHIAQIHVTDRFDISEAYEPKLLGSAGTITANRDLADGVDEVLLIYADNLSSIDLGELLRFHREHDDPMTMMLFRAENPSACGIAELDSENRIVSFEEKPADPKSNVANAGLYVVSADAYREIADMGAFDLGFDVLPKFVGRMRGFVHDGYHRDIGTMEALAAAEHEVADAFANHGSRK